MIFYKASWDLESHVRRGGQVQLRDLQVDKSLLTKGKIQSVGGEASILQAHKALSI